MGDSLERMTGAMERLGIYALRCQSLVDRELAAYDAGFAAAQKVLDDILRGAFVQTAAGDALERHEAMVGLSPRQELDDDTRRALVMYRMGTAPLDFTKEGILNSIRASGMEAELIEDTANEAVTVKSIRIIDKSLDLDRLMAGIDAMLPAHLEYQIDMGEMSWDMFEMSGASWDEWDGKDFVWNDFDLYGHIIFK